MLINAYRDPPPVFGGSRMLANTLGVVGREVSDPHQSERIWTIENVYAPASGRAVGGVRIKARDQKNVISFINQRDFEVLLGLGRIGQWCPWNEARYVGPDDANWIGFSADDDDLRDDLYEEELALRQTYSVLPPGIELVRLVHLARGTDRLERWVFLQDRHPTSGAVPDPSFSTLLQRWSRYEREIVHWERL